jgi:hypothetical protein
MPRYIGDPTEVARIQLRAKALEMIAEIIDRPDGHNLYKPAKDEVGGLRPALPPSEFKGIDVDWYLADRDDLFVYTDATPDVVWPIDVCVMMHHPAEDDEHLAIRRFRSIEPREARRFSSNIKRFSRYMSRMSFARLDTHRLTASVIMAWVGGQWVQAEVKQNWKLLPHHEWIPQERYEPPADDREADHVCCCIATMVGLKRRYEWGVEVGMRNGPSVIFTTDPTGCRALFRDRERGESGRRDALKTWVTDHWRQLRHDPDLETYVREHLRGNLTFEWRGLECRIHVPSFEIERNEALAGLREDMRRPPRTDRRLRHG